MIICQSHLAAGTRILLIFTGKQPKGLPSISLLVLANLVDHHESEGPFINDNVDNEEKLEFDAIDSASELHFNFGNTSKPLLTSSLECSLNFS